MIEVVNMKYHRDFGKPGDCRCDRSTKYGNPFIIYETKDRNKVCSLYDDYLDAITTPNNEDMVKTLLKLGGLTPVQVDMWMRKTNGYLDLRELKDVKRMGCFCAPSPCHCDYLKRKIEASVTPVLEIDSGRRL
jgi:hypothetical protein